LAAARAHRIIQSRRRCRVGSWAFMPRAGASLASRRGRRAFPGRSGGGRRVGDGWGGRLGWVAPDQAGALARLSVPGVACPLLGEEEEPDPALAAGCAVVHDVDERQVAWADGDAEFALFEVAAGRSVWVREFSTDTAYELIRESARRARTRCGFSLPGRCVGTAADRGLWVRTVLSYGQLAGACGCSSLVGR
jgi:hypothetical protein